MRRYLNSQKYDECQLVVLLNALIYYKLPPVDPASAEYERLVDLVDARFAGAEDIYKASEYLRLDLVPDQFSLTNIKGYLMSGIPVATTVRDDTYDYHSILIVDWKIENGNVFLKIPNWSTYTKRLWVSWDILKTHIPVWHENKFGYVNGGRPRKLLHAILKA